MSSTEQSEKAEARGFPTLAISVLPEAAFSPGTWALATAWFRKLGWGRAWTSPVALTSACFYHHLVDALLPVWREVWFPVSTCRSKWQRAPAERAFFLGQAGQSFIVIPRQKGGLGKSGKALPSSHSLCGWRTSFYTPADSVLLPVPNSLNAPVVAWNTWKMYVHTLQNNGTCTAAGCTFT